MLKVSESGKITPLAGVKEVPVHVLMILAGIYLSESHPTISVLSLQEEALKSDAVGYRIPFDKCKEALDCLVVAKFLKCLSDNVGGNSGGEYAKV